jgi:hypothetical protein
MPRRFWPDRPSLSTPYLVRQTEPCRSCPEPTVHYGAHHLLSAPARTDFPTQPRTDFPDQVLSDFPTRSEAVRPLPARRSTALRTHPTTQIPTTQIHPYPPDIPDRTGPSSTIQSPTCLTIQSRPPSDNPARSDADKPSRVRPPRRPRPTPIRQSNPVLPLSHPTYRAIPTPLIFGGMLGDLQLYSAPATPSPHPAPAG